MRGSSAPTTSASTWRIPRAARAAMASPQQGVNVNEGAESTLMWLTAVEHIRAFRDVQPRSQRGAELLATSAR